MARIQHLTKDAGRSIELENAGRVLQFVFIGEAPDEEAAAIRALPLFKGRRRAEINNYLLKIEGGRKIALFDYRHGKHAESVVAAEVPALAVPEFSLRPERVADRLLLRNGHRDIDFAAFPDFSKRYLLRGADANAVRRLFTDHRVAALENHETFALSGAGGRLAYFEPDRLVWPGAVAALLGRAMEVFHLFTV